MKLALHLIVKDQLNEVIRICEDYGKYFDEIVMAVDIDVEKFREHFKPYEYIKVLDYKWKKDFADKRNFVVENTESDYYLRMDTDDSLSGAENIRAVFSDCVSRGIDIVYTPYLYSTDVDGNCDGKHWRETLIRNTKDIYWNKTVHENLLPSEGFTPKVSKDSRVQIIHNLTQEHAEESRDRNLEILLDEWKRDKENTDPRTIGYIGRMMMSYAQWEKAITFLELLIQKSGWDDDKYFAWCEVASCHFRLCNYDNAISACNEALAINPEFPQAYNRLCEVYLERKEYKKAIHWGLIGLMKSKDPNTLIVLDPTTYKHRALATLGMAYLGLGDFDNAKKFMDQASKMAPSDEFIKSQKDLIDEAVEKDKYFKSFAELFFKTKTLDESKTIDLVKSIPKQLLKDERLQGLKNRTLPPKNWGEKSIVIYCGNSWETWAAPSVVNGIGGSEEAVIYISQEFVKLGYSVTVFNDCADLEGDYEGVSYRSFFEFNPRDQFDILIGWRNNYFSPDIKARKKLVWLHDVPQQEMFKDLFFDKVLVLSEFHKSLLKDWVPEEKIFVTANGINLKDFEGYQERNPKRMIYTSSYDRGISNLLEVWPEVKKEVPDAELHLYYGWNTYDKMMRVGFRTPDMKNYLLKLMNQEGVFDHGRVGHQDLVQEFLKSGVYVYPCHFEEISCISAMKSQAAGCVPVVTNYAALNETVKAGVKVSGQGGQGTVNLNFKNRLVEILKDTEKQEELRKEVLKNKDSFGWDKVAKQWKEGLFD